MVNSQAARGIGLGLYLCIYMIFGFYTELNSLTTTPLPDKLLEDFGYYERALVDGINGRDVYAIREIGSGYLYPPPALLVVEIFASIQPIYLKAAIYWVVNIALLSLAVFGVARRYGHPLQSTWYWYALCLGSVPFLAVLHLGQINTFTLFGIFLMFIGETSWPALSGAGLALAVMTKVTPLLFFVYLAANRRFKVMAWALAFLAAVTGLAALRYGLASALEYPGVLQWLVSQIPVDFDSQSLAARLFRLARWAQLNASAFPGPLQAIAASASALLMSNLRVVQGALTIYVLTVVLVSGLLTYLGKQPREPLFIVTALGMMLQPNVIWYHHYLFMLLPLLVWMAWSGLDKRVVAWCLAGLLILQFERTLPPYGLLVHAFGHLSIVAMLVRQVREFSAFRRHGHAAGSALPPPG